MASMCVRYAARTPQTARASAASMMSRRLRTENVMTRSIMPRSRRDNGVSLGEFGEVQGGLLPERLLARLAADEHDPPVHHYLHGATHRVVVEVGTSDGAGLL